MPVHLDRPAVVFLSRSNRLSSDPAVRRTVLEVRELIAQSAPGAPPQPASSALEPYAVFMVDGQGRTVPSEATGNGLLGADLWRRFANTGPALVSQPVGQGETGFARLRMNADAVEGGGKVRLSREVQGFVPDIVGELSTTWVEPDEIPVAVVWPAPFDALFFGAAALEAWEAHARLQEVMSLAESGLPVKALAMAETALAQRFNEVTLPSISDLWALCAIHDGEETLLAEADGMYGIDRGSVDRLATDRRFLEHVRVPTRVPYVAGFIGYIWLRLVEELRAGRVPRRCDACNNVLPRGVTKRRRYCSAAENLDCFKRHRAGYERARQDHS